jgi:hypothetical protein
MAQTLAGLGILVVALLAAQEILWTKKCRSRHFAV